MSIKVFIDKANYSSMLANAEEYPSVETGGLLFGEFLDDRIVIRKVVNPETECKREIAYFEIREEFAKSMTKATEKSGIEYLGNWHKHLGYGGPSHGDDNQMAEYFSRNRNKKKAIALIVDYGRGDPHPYVGVYSSYGKKVTKEFAELKFVSEHEIEQLEEPGESRESSLALAKKVARDLREELEVEPEVVEREITQEHLILIPLAGRIRESVRRTRLIRFFFYISLPYGLSADGSEIYMGILSHDRSVDVSVVKIRYDLVLNRYQEFLKGTKRLCDKSPDYIRLPVSAFLEQQ